MRQDTNVSGLVTIDVEPDNVWANTHSFSFENIRYLSAFHHLCQDYGVRPTYLVSWSVANNDECVGFLNVLLRQGNCEIGIHPHLWEIPPLIETEKTGIAWVGPHYATDVLEAKITSLVNLITQKFGAPKSHRAGRWGIDSRQVAILAALGIRVDTSIIPGVNWSSTGVLDHTHAPLAPYYMDNTDIFKYGASSLLQVPCTIKPSFCFYGLEKKWPISAVLKHIGLGYCWLRVSPFATETEMLNTCQWAIKRFTHLNLMSHSSEFMPAGSPYWKTEFDIVQQFAKYRSLFAWWRSNGVVPKTLTEFEANYQSRPAYNGQK